MLPLLEVNSVSTIVYNLIELMEDKKELNDFSSFKVGDMVVIEDNKSSKLEAFNTLFYAIDNNKITPAESSYMNDKLFNDCFIVLGVFKKLQFDQFVRVVESCTSLERAKKYWSAAGMCSVLHENIDNRLIVLISMSTGEMCCEIDSYVNAIGILIERVIA